VLWLWSRTIVHCPGGFEFHAVAEGAGEDAVFRVEADVAPAEAHGMDRGGVKTVLVRVGWASPSAGCHQVRKSLSTARRPGRFGALVDPSVCRWLIGSQPVSEDFLSGRVFPGNHCGSEVARERKVRRWRQFRPVHADAALITVNHARTHVVEGPELALRPGNNGAAGGAVISPCAVRRIGLRFCG